MQWGWGFKHPPLALWKKQCDQWNVGRWPHFFALVREVGHVWRYPYPVYRKLTQLFWGRENVSEPPPPPPSTFFYGCRDTSLLLTKHPGASHASHFKTPPLKKILRIPLHALLPMWLIQHQQIWSIWHPVANCKTFIPLQDINLCSFSSHNILIHCIIYLKFHFEDYFPSD